MKFIKFNKKTVKLTKKVKIKFYLVAILLCSAWESRGRCLPKSLSVLTGVVLSSYLRALHSSFERTAMLPQSYCSYSTPISVTQNNKQNEASQLQASSWERNTLLLIT